MRKPRIVERRPAEVGSIVAAVAALLASFGVELSAAQYRGLMAGLGLVAAVVTWWRSHRPS